MTSTLIANLAEHYQWQLSLVTAISIFAVVMLIRLAERLNPTLRAAAVHNKNVYNKKMERPSYAANHRWNRKWSLAYLVVIFGMVLPFALSSEAQPWWQIAIDIFVILMVYDFFYYLTHRFVFHDSAFFGGPLLWMHAVHHRQHNP